MTASVKFCNIDEALNFLLLNKSTPVKNLNIGKVNEAIKCFEELNSGSLPSHVIQKLCQMIIFSDCYGKAKQKQLLFTCIPASSQEFPHEIIPLAVSYLDGEKKPGLFCQGILQWILGLLEHRLISKENIYLRLCYTSFFHMISKINLCQLASRIVYFLTKKCDVTPCRIAMLHRLRKMGWASNGVSLVLRMYHLFRPDLTIIPTSRITKFNKLPKQLVERLSSASDKMEFDDENDHMWLDLMGGRKANPYTELSCVPNPDFSLYVDKIEERRLRKIPVLQYRSILDMIKDLRSWRDWQWPNNSSSLLRKPLVISLFCINDTDIRINLSNWLELALREEVINKQGSVNPQRPVNLLKSVVSLLKSSEQLFLTVYYFLVDFFIYWDGYSFIQLILEIVPYMPYISSTLFFRNIFKSLSKVLSSCSIFLWCEIISCLTDTAIHWAIDAAAKSQSKRYGVQDSGSLVGILDLTFHLEFVFLASIQRLGSSSILLNAIISYYTKVNMVAYALNLPLFIAPPTAFVLVVLSSLEIVAMDRLSSMFVNMKESVEQMKKMKNLDKDRKKIKGKCLLSSGIINNSIIFLLDSLITNKAFGSRWQKLLSQFLNSTSLRRLCSVNGISDFLCAFRALPFVSISRSVVNVDSRHLTSEEWKKLLGKIFQSQAESNICGIGLCYATYIEN